jgi:hypothetical protein
VIIEIKDHATGQLVVNAYLDSEEDPDDAVAKFNCAIKRAIKLFPNAVLTHNVPVIAHLDARILAAIERGGKLDMSNWHEDADYALKSSTWTERPVSHWCHTSHCRAGWAEVIAVADGHPRLGLGPDINGQLIYAASRPNQTNPDFYTTDENAMADLKRCAALDPLPPDQVI